MAAQLNMSVACNAKAAPAAPARPVARVSAFRLQFSGRMPGKQQLQQGLQSSSAMRRATTTVW
jgi:hypothetical protein